MPQDSPNAWLRYGTAFVSVALATWARAMLTPVLGEDHPFATLFFAVLFTAWYGGFWPAVVAAVLGAFSSACFLIPFTDGYPLRGAANQVGMGLYLALSLGFAYLGGVVRSAQARAEQHRREGEERLRLLVDAVKDYAIFMLDPQGRVTTWNAGAESTTGYTASEAIGQHLSYFYPREAAEAGRRAQGLAAALANGRFEEEGWRARKDGSLFWASMVLTPALDGAGRLLGFAHVTRDRTERRQAENLARESEARLHAVIEGMSEGVVIAGLDGVVRYWNRAALDMHGLAPARDWRLHLADFDASMLLFTLSGEAVEVKHWPLARVLRGEQLEGCELLVRNVEQGRQRVLRYGGHIITDVTGRRVGFLTVLDVTRQKQDEQALTRHAEDLARINQELAHKNAENETFVYSVSHDLRSPLVNLQGFSKELGLAAGEMRSLLMQEAVPQQVREQALSLLERDVTESLHFIQTGVTRLSNIIDALLRLSRAGRIEYQWQRVDVRKVVERVVESMKGTIGQRGAEVSVGALPAVWGDPTALEQVFANLIGNALNYLDPSRPGRIEVGCRATDAGPAYYVRDNGLGIAEAYREKAFQAFQRLHPDRARGEGMGLTIVRRIVDRHRGKAWIESQVGQGSTFFVSLPDGPPGPQPGER